MSGRYIIPTDKWCTNCNSECLTEYEGRVVLAIGLNNALHGGEEPFVRFDIGNNEPRNAQVFTVNSMYFIITYTELLVRIKLIFEIISKNTGLEGLCSLN